MGRQIRAFLTLKDSKSLFEHLRDKLNVALVDQQSPQSRFTLRHDLPKRGESKWWNEKYILRSSDARKLVISRMNSGIYRIDDARSPVVEWTRCGVSGGKLGHSRFWCDTSSNPCGKLVEPIFQEIKRWVVRNSVPLKGEAFYVSHDAARHSKTGGSLNRDYMQVASLAVRRKYELFEWPDDMG